MNCHQERQTFFFFSWIGLEIYCLLKWAGWPLENFATVTILSRPTCLPLSLGSCMSLNCICTWWKLSSQLYLEQEELMGYCEDTSLKFWKKLLYSFIEWILVVLHPFFSSLPYSFPLEPFSTSSPLLTLVGGPLNLIASCMGGRLFTGTRATILATPLKKMTPPTTINRQ